MKRTTAIWTFLGGATLGAITALLYAPQKGKYLRAEIGRKATQTADDITSYVRDAAAKASTGLRTIMKKSEAA